MISKDQEKFLKVNHDFFELYSLLLWWVAFSQMHFFSKTICIHQNMLLSFLEGPLFASQGISWLSTSLKKTSVKEKTRRIKIMLTLKSRRQAQKTSTSNHDNLFFLYIVVSHSLRYISLKVFSNKKK
jgi:hypothetical protein